MQATENCLIHVPQRYLKVYHEKSSVVSLVCK